MPESALNLLETIGGDIILKAKKVRGTYFNGKFHIKVDTLAGIGRLLSLP